MTRKSRIHAPWPPLMLSFAVMVPIAAVMVPNAAMAQSSQARRYQIAAQPLGSGLTAFGQISGLQISVDAALIAGRNGHRVDGEFGAAEALSRLLEGTGLRYRINGSLVTLDMAPTADGAVQLGAVRVAGTGAGRTAPPVGAVIGTLPDTYGGGQVARGGRFGLLGNRDNRDVPFALTGFTDQFRQDVQARSISDLVEYSVGVTTAQTGDANQNDVVYLRGFRTSISNGAIDGLPGLLNRQAPVEPFERIEVLLGPTAFINGRPDNVGGTLNLTPKRAADDPLTRIGIGFVSHSTWNGHADIGRRFGQNGAFGVRANLSYLDGGIATRPGQRSATTASIATDYRSDSVRVTFDYIYNDRHQAPGSTQGITLSSDTLAIPRAPDAGTLFSQPWARYDRSFHLALGRAEWDFAKNWTLAAAYGVSRDSEQQVSLFDTLLNAAGNTRVATIGTSNNRIAMTSGEVMVRGAMTTGSIQHKLAVGYNRYTREGRNGFTAATPATPITSNLYNPVYYPDPNPKIASLLPNPINDTVTQGLFVTDEVILFDERLRVLIGLRNTQIDQRIFNGTSGVRTSRYKADKLTPALGVVVRANDWLSLYANHVQALEQGAIAGDLRANAGELFPPTTAQQNEIGAKADFGTFAATLSLYDIDRASLYTDTRTNRLVLDGRQVNRGIEFSLAGEPVQGLRLYAGASLVDAKIKQTAIATNNGRIARGVPDYSLRANIDWDVPVVTGLALTLSVLRNGEQPFDVTNNRTLAGWTRIDAGARYTASVAGRGLTVRLDVDNVADKNYWASADLGALYAGAPRTVTLSATIDF